MIFIAVLESVRPDFFSASINKILMSVIITVGDIAHQIAQEVVRECRPLSLHRSISICSICKQQNDLLETLRHHLEMKPCTHVLLMYSEVGTVSASVLATMNTHFPSVLLAAIQISIFSSAACSGFESLEELFTLHLALDHAVFVGVRCIDETMQLLVAREVKEVSLATVYKTIAVDLLLLITLFSCSSRSDLSFLPCSHKSKSCDIRSSLWRQTLFPVKPGRDEPVTTKLRDACINLHHLYTHCQSTSSEAITCSLSNFYLDKCQSSYTISSAVSTYVKADLDVALDWATPAWRYSTLNLPTNSCKSSAMVTKEYAVALVFESPYARERMRQCCDRAEALVSSGAYLHRFVREGITADDILDCIAAVRQYI